MANILSKLNIFKDNRPDPEAQALHRNPMPVRSLEDIRASAKPYRHQPYVALSLDRIADEFASARLAVYTTIDGQELEVSGHPFVELLNNPNPEDTYTDLMTKTVKSYSLGDCFWWLWGDKNGMPEAIWHIPAERIRVESSLFNRSAKYIYEYQGIVENFDVNEIVHFKRASIDDDFYGDNLLTPIINEIALDLEMSKFQLNFFGNYHATVAGILSVPLGMAKAAYTKFKEEFYHLFGGGKRRTLVTQANMDGETIGFTPMGLNHQEMEFIESRKANRQTIFEQLGLSTGMFSEASTEAHARVSERNFLRSVFYRHKAIAQRIDKDILNRFYGEFNLKFEDVRTGDAQQLLQRRQASEGILSVNEQRQEFFGAEPIDEQLVKKDEGNASTE